MKQELGPNQTKWLAALRSGEYKQCRLRLEDCGSHCCLGVAVRLFEKSEGFIEGSSLDFHEPTMDALALADEYGCSEKRGFEALVRLNDIMNKSFAEIADIVESDPSAYFTETR